MKNEKCSLIITLISCAMPTLVRAESPSLLLDPLYVRSESLTQPWNLREAVVGSGAMPGTDAADLVGQLPGAAVLRNGALTGIVQLRGLSGDRVAVRVNGMSITPACPNHMDPPLHYADPAAGDRVALFAGISPVTEGGDQLGGVVAIERPDPEFSAANRFSGEMRSSFRGSNDAFLLGGALSWSTPDLVVGYRGSAATADDLRFPGGTVRASGYDTTRHALTAAWRTQGGFVEVDSGFTVTRDAGTPALPMDMIEDDSRYFGLRNEQTFAWGQLENRIYMHEIDHLMDNHSLRSVTAGTMAMDAPADSRDFGFDSRVTIPKDDSTWRAGLDFHRAEFDAEQVAITTGLRRDTFQDNRRTKTGLHLDWEHQWHDSWSTRIGVRGDRVASDAGPVANAILPPPGPMRNRILADQAAFNSADRSFDDLMLDAVAAARYSPDKHTSIEFAVALKNRAPSLVERYLWTPLNASAGLADGRTYLGNLALDPESALEFAIACEHRADRWAVSLTPFCQRVSDYIQGMPIARLDSAGKPVLQYQNTGRANLYGAEIAARCDLTDELTLRATASYVRGKNHDTGDDLYRIAPLRGILDLVWQRGEWEAHFETMLADSQNHVSAIQGEDRSPGYGIFNLRLAKDFGEQFRIEGGIENLLDHRYSDHLGGVNRVGGSDVAIGERIPAAGRFGYVSLTWRF